MHRAKEVGIRKSIGAFRNQLIEQFMMESVLINLISAILSAGLASLILPILANIIDQELQLSLLAVPAFWLWFMIVIFVGSILSGAFPAFVLSAFKPVSMLGTHKANKPGGLNLRKG